MSLSELKQIFVMLGMQDAEIRPLVKEFVGIVYQYSKELEPLFSGLTEWIVKNKIKSIKLFMDNGFTKDEAIQLTSNVYERIEKVLKDSNTNRKK